MGLCSCGGLNPPKPTQRRGHPVFQERTNLATAQVSLYIANKPADEMHLVSTEDVQYQPFVSVRELHVLERRSEFGTNTENKILLFFF